MVRCSTYTNKKYLSSWHWCSVSGNVNNLSLRIAVQLTQCKLYKITHWCSTYKMLIIWAYTLMFNLHNVNYFRFHMAVQLTQWLQSCRCQAPRNTGHGPAWGQEHRRRSNSSRPVAWSSGKSVQTPTCQIWEAFQITF
jgi:hypothetical protein